MKNNDLEPKSILELSVTGIDGKETPLSDYSGKVLLIVNTASRCGFTPQYAGLEALYRKYRDRGFVVLGFPCNDFLGQEPGTEAEILSFCSLKYDVTFPLFAKVRVKGKAAAPLYRFLVSQTANPGFDGAIPWNFTKFLVGRDGNIAGRFEPRIAPDDASLVEAIEKALASDSGG